MASVFRQMLVMVKTVEARSTSKTGQRDSQKFQVSFTTQVKRRNLSFQMFKQSFQINEFRTNAISNAIVCKAYQAKVHPKPESRLSPIFAGIFREILVSVSVSSVCVSVSPQVTSRPAAAFKLFMQTTTSTASFENWESKQLCQLHPYAMPLCCAKKRVSVSNCAFSWQRWKLRIRLENFKQISQLGKSLKHQPCSGPRLNFLLDFFCLKFFISTLPTTTLSKDIREEDVTCTATMGTRVIHWSFKTITELEILWTFAMELSSPAVASRLKVLQVVVWAPKKTQHLI